MGTFLKQAVRVQDDSGYSATLLVPKPPKKPNQDYHKNIQTLLVVPTQNVWWGNHHNALLYDDAPIDNLSVCNWPNFENILIRQKTSTQYSPSRPETGNAVVGRTNDTWPTAGECWDKPNPRQDLIGAEQTEQELKDTANLIQDNGE